MTIDEAFKQMLSAINFDNYRLIIGEEQARGMAAKILETLGTFGRSSYAVGFIDGGIAERKKGGD